MELQAGDEINSIPYEILILGYLRQIYDNQHNVNMTATIINLCYMFYVDQSLIDKIDLFIENEINEVTELLDTTNDQSLLLLLDNTWDSMFISDKYFNDPVKTLVKAGCHSSDNHQITAVDIDTAHCQFCTEFNETLFSLECKHQIMCENCWLYYLKSSLNSLHCVSLTCPKNECNVIIPRSVWNDFLLKQHKLYYQLYLTYVRQNCMNYSKGFTKCGNTKCKRVYFSYKGISRVRWCTCGSFFNCSACKDTLHFPMSCDYAQVWNSKISSQADTVKRIVDGRYKCPKCQLDLGEIQGSLNVTCFSIKAPYGCRYEFCRLCKVDWSKHVDENQTWFDCDDIERDEEETFEYYFRKHESHLQFTYQTKLKKILLGKINVLITKFNWTIAGDKVYEIWGVLHLVTRCHQIIAWIYAMLYYLDDTKVNLVLFKPQVRALEKFCVQLRVKLNYSVDQLADKKILTKIVNYADTVRKYLTNITNYIESDIDL